MGNIAIRIAAPGARAASTRAALLGSVCIGALAMLVPETAHALDGNWQGPGAEWTIGTNWSSSPNVPDGTATFTNNGAPTSVTISNSESINTIQFTAVAPAYSFTVTNGATFTINNGIANNSSSLPTFSIDSSATLSFAGNSNTTFAGTITGTGALEIDDSALLTLTRLGSSIGGVLVCNCDSNGLTISGGSLNVTDPGLGTVVEGGTLSVINGGKLQTTSLAVVESSALVIDGAGSTVTVSPSGPTEFASIGGPVTVTISNGGVLNTPGLAAIDALNQFFTPTVTVTGAGSTWNVGSLAVGGGGTFGGPGILTISNGGVVNATGPLGVGDPTGTSTLTVTGAGSTLNALSSLVVGDTSCGCGLIGTLTVANGGVVNSSGFTGIAQGSTLNLGTGGLAGAIITPAIENFGQVVANFTDTVTLAARISGSGTLSKAGTGTLILTGNSSYSGATTVNAGTLVVNGSIANSAVTVNSGATLGGSGIVGTTSINTGGIFAPGTAGAPAAMTVQGNLAFQSGALYLVRVTPSNASSDKVTSGGTATLAGTVQAAFASGTYATRAYTILSAAGGLGGTTFNSLTTTNLPAGFAASLSYTNSEVILNLTAQLHTNAISANGLSVNQKNVATALDNFFNSGGTLPPGFVSVFGLTGSNLGNALSQLSGEAATAAQQGAFQMGNQFLGPAVSIDITRFSARFGV